MYELTCFRIMSSLIPNSALKKYEVLSLKLLALTQKTLQHICLQITSADISQLQIAYKFFSEEKQ